MASSNAKQMAVLAQVPQAFAAAADVGGALRVFNEKVTFASQASGDTINCGKLPVGARPLFFIFITDTSTGTATLSLGVSGSAAKYKAAAAFTALDTPTLYGVTANVGEALTAAEDLFLTVGTAALPAAGTLRVIAVYSVNA